MIDVTICDRISQFGGKNGKRKEAEADGGPIAGKKN